MKIIHISSLVFCLTFFSCGETVINKNPLSESENQKEEVQINTDFGSEIPVSQKNNDDVEFLEQSIEKSTSPPNYGSNIFGHEADEHEPEALEKKDIELDKNKYLLEISKLMLNQPKDIFVKKINFNKFAMDELIVSGCHWVNIMSDGVPIPRLICIPQKKISNKGVFDVKIYEVINLNKHILNNVQLNDTCVQLDGNNIFNIPHGDFISLDSKNLSKGICECIEGKMSCF